MEIIEFPVVLIDTRSMKQVACFHTFIKPEIYPTLTDFCKELTGISQEEVDGGVVLQVAIRQLHSFLLENEVFGSNYAFVSCGSFDANAIKWECSYKELFVPSYLKRWINIQQVFPIHKYCNDRENYVDDVYAIKQDFKILKTIQEFLEMCGLEFEGREHSGIDDAKNIARVILSCLKKGFAFHEGHVLTHNYQTGPYAGVD